MWTESHCQQNLYAHSTHVYSIKGIWSCTLYINFQFSVSDVYSSYKVYVCMYIVCMLKLVLCTVFHWLKAASFHCTDLHMWSINVTDREVYLPCGRLPWLRRDPLSSTVKYVYWSRQQCLRLWCYLNHLLLGVPCEHFSEISPLYAFFLTLLVVISSNLCFQLYCGLLTYVRSHLLYFACKAQVSLCIGLVPFRITPLLWQMLLRNSTSELWLATGLPGA